MKIAGCDGKRIFLVLLAIVLCAFAPGAAGDGIYIPERAFKKPPAIPSQRALIVFRDGVENLIVESTLDGKGRSFGWIVPVPAVPTDLAAVSPGIMDVLDFHTQPRITHDLGEYFVPICFLALFLVLLCAWVVSARGAKLSTSYPVLVLLMLCLLLASALLLPHLARAPGIQSTSVTVLSTARIGNYDVSVLEARDEAALASWLDANGFAFLPAEGLPIVGDYIAQGWVFVTAKLVRDGSGRAAPHPLSVTFPTAKPVYPMRLTALAGTRLALDLYVLADRQAQVDGLRLEYCDTYSAPLSAADGDHTFRWVMAESSGRELAHPALVNLVWPGAVLTKLSAEVEPAEMNADYVLSMAAPVADLPHVFSRQGARQTAALTALVFWSVMLFVLTLVKRRSIRERSRAYAVKRIVLPVTVASLLIVPFLYFALPKVDVVTRGRHFFSDRAEAKTLTREAALLFLALEGFQEEGVAEIRAFFAERLRQVNYRNYVTGEPITMEDSPGNFTIHEKDGRIIFTAYTMTGRPYKVTLREPETKETVPAPVSTDSMLNASGPTGAEPPNEK